MSVTFAPALGPVTGWAINCACPSSTGPVFGDRNDATAWLATYNQAPTPLLGCTDDLCVAYIPAISPVEEHQCREVNVSQSNAVLVLRTLGLCGDDEQSIEDAFQGGVIDAHGLLGRVLLAEAIAPADEGVPAHVVAGPGAQVIECGRHWGYLQERLAQVRTVAEFAITHDRQVTWG